MATPSPPQPQSSSPPPSAHTAAPDESAAASEIKVAPPLSSASGDTVVRVGEEEGGEQMREEGKEDKRNEEWLDKMQGWLLILATVVATVTYSAGVSPPGGFWQEDRSANDTEGHTAGNPVLADKNQPRYLVFFISNSSAFVTSLVVIVLLLRRSYFHSVSRIRLLFGSLLGGLFNLFVAFCAASTRNLVAVVPIVYMLVATFVSISVGFWLFKKISSKPASRAKQRMLQP